MRLQVEMATASSISSCATSSVMKRVGGALGQRQALAQRHGRGVVRDAEDEQLHQRAHRLALALLGALVGQLLELGQLALEARQLGGHDHHVDEDQREEDEIGGGDVAGVVRQRVGHALVPRLGAAVRPCGATASSPPSLRRSERSCAEVCLEAISYFHSVAKSSAIPIRHR